MSVLSSVEWCHNFYWQFGIEFPLRFYQHCELLFKYANRKGKCIVKVVMVHAVAVILEWTTKQKCNACNVWHAFNFKFDTSKPTDMIICKFISVDYRSLICWLCHVKFEAHSSSHGHSTNRLTELLAGWLAGWLNEWINNNAPVL